MRQNSGAYIICKLPHPMREGEYLEGNGTRYNLAFRGQTLPDGSVAETVYILWNEPFYTILNNSPRRPLDYDYLKLLSSASGAFTNSSASKFLQLLNMVIPTPKSAIPNTPNMPR